MPRSPPFEGGHPKVPLLRGTPHTPFLGSCVPHPGESRPPKGGRGETPQDIVPGAWERGTLGVGNRVTPQESPKIREIIHTRDPVLCMGNPLSNLQNHQIRVQHPTQPSSLQHTWGRHVQPVPSSHMRCFLSPLTRVVFLLG
jgi:hypothetical protein